MSCLPCGCCSHLRERPCCRASRPMSIRRFYLLSLSLFTDIFGDSDASLACLQRRCGVRRHRGVHCGHAPNVPAGPPACLLPPWPRALCSGSIKRRTPCSYAFGLLISVGVMALGLSLLAGTQPTLPGGPTCPYGRRVLRPLLRHVCKPGGFDRPVAVQAARPDRLTGARLGRFSLQAFT